MDSTGNLTITFSEQMNTNYSLQYLNETFIKVYVQPYQQSEPSRNLNLTWNVTSFESRDLKINVKFEEPLQISIEKFADKIMFEVNDTQIKVFEAVNQSKVLSKNITSLSLPKQMI